MRQIQEYWPPIFQEVREFIEIANVENPEMESLWQAAESLMDDQFIETATERGIARREKMLDIVPFADDDLESRRFRVLAKWGEKLPYTYRVLTDKLNTLCGQDGYTMTLSTDLYTLDIKIELTKKRMFEEVSKLTRQMVPVNMVITVELRYNQYGNMRAFTYGQLSNLTHSYLRNEVI